MLIIGKEGKLCKHGKTTQKEWEEGLELDRAEILNNLNSRIYNGLTNFQFYGTLHLPLQN